MKNVRVVPKKNYVYLFLLLVVVVLLTLFIIEVRNKYNEEKLKNSFLNGYINDVSIDELNNIIREPSTDLFILLTKTDDINVYNTEVNIKNVIKKNDLRDNFIYIDCKDISDYSKINKLFSSDIKTIPSILYLKNGELVKSIEYKIGENFSDELAKLIDEYEVR